jgi:TRAP-type C4-dicarboxylate transport system permease small subunit
MERLKAVLADIFGVIFLALSFVVAIEAVARKLFDFSLQGADELGGYALAIGSTIGFALAVGGRNHVRVDVFHARLSPASQAVLNWLSSVSLGAVAVFLAAICLRVVLDTFAYGSTAQTPWATPLIWPQSLWYLGLLLFALFAVLAAVRATRMLVSGRLDLLNEEFHPKSTKEELKDELDSIASRGDAGPGAPR